MEKTYPTSLKNLEEFVQTSTDIGAISKTAINTAYASGLPGPVSGPADAYRHMLVIGEITRRYGVAVGKAVGSAHEIVGSQGGQRDSDQRMDEHNNAIGVDIGRKAKTWEDVVRQAREKIDRAYEKGSDRSERNRPYWNDNDDNWSDDWKERAIPKIAGGNVDNRYKSGDSTPSGGEIGGWPGEEPSGKDAKPSTIDEDAIRNLGASLTQPVDAVDEALLKDDLTEGELSGLMRSNPYLSPTDPRHGAAQDRVREWYEDRWGSEPMKVDGTGRMVTDGRPEIAAPEFADIAVEYPTGRPLDEAVGDISGIIMDQARKASPFEAVKALQYTLNDQDDPNVRPRPVLKPDGVAGPNTRRALRFATQRLGTDRLLSDYKANAVYR